ncbi:hypothetical protein [Maricaulis sp. CAU 1757]
MHSALWWRDFEFEDGVVTVKKTGARLPVEPGLIGEVLSWLPFYVVAEGWRLRNLSRSGPRIWFAPDRPRPWYLVWSVLHAAGARIAETPDQADAVFLFDDSTTGPGLDLPAGTLAINRDCQSIAKSHVAEVFEECFGYSLAVDPAHWTGPMVEKSERNGAHDGRIISGPCEARPGHVYQRVIDNTVAGDKVEDIRCPTLGGHIPLVMLKRRPLADRFSNSNDTVSVAETDSVFTPDERDRLAAFARRMKLDWGGLDVLRDRRDGRIFVVDVNKTELGPPVAMGLEDRIHVTRRLADAFLVYMRQAEAGRTPA